MSTIIEKARIVTAETFANQLDAELVKAIAYQGGFVEKKEWNGKTVIANGPDAKTDWRIVLNTTTETLELDDNHDPEESVVILYGAHNFGQRAMRVVTTRGMVRALCESAMLDIRCAYKGLAPHAVTTAVMLLRTVLTDLEQNAFGFYSSSIPATEIWRDILAH